MNIAAGLLAIAIAAVLQVVAYWIASKMLVSENNSFGSACKLWLLILAGVIGSLVLAGIVIAAGSALHNTPVIVVGFIGLVLLMLYVAFSTTMKVYKISFLRAFAFLLIAGAIVQLVEQLVVPLAFKNTALGGSYEARGRQRAAVWNAVLAQLQNGKSIAPIAPTPAPLSASDAQIAADRTQPLAARRAALQRWRDALEARRVALKPQDQAAIAAYKQEAQRYGELFHELDAGTPK